MSPSDTHPGVLHRISVLSTEGALSSSGKPLVAFEHIPNPNHNVHSPTQNTLIFMGGLFDGLLSVPFVPPIVSALPPSWSLVEPILSSAYRQFGFSTLGESVAEIGGIIEYFRKLRPQGKVVLLGHSTGSQLVIHYLLSNLQLPPIDGGIMQASVSDREAILMFVSQSDYDSTCRLAQSYVDDGRGEDILPFKVTQDMFLRAPVSAKRWLSLASPGPLHNGEDDYFSSDLDDERLRKTFGQVGRKGARLMFLFGGADQFVPSTIDRTSLVEKWHHHIRQGGGIIDQASGVVEKAGHTIPKNGPGLEDLVGRILGFLKNLGIVAVA